MPARSKDRCYTRGTRVRQLEVFERTRGAVPKSFPAPPPWSFPQAGKLALARSFLFSPTHLTHRRVNTMTSNELQIRRMQPQRRHPSLGSNPEVYPFILSFSALAGSLRRIKGPTDQFQDESVPSRPSQSTKFPHCVEVSRGPKTLRAFAHILRAIHITPSARHHSTVLKASSKKMTQFTTGKSI
ncbi:hypothetical protein PM082_020381 [Marasmius tenuissimus]|nr:hypothetical protein PM082_020381 [Marasmius tenuissimus]